MPAAVIEEPIAESAAPGDARESVAVLATERLEAEITELAGQLAAGELEQPRDEVHINLVGALPADGHPVTQGRVAARPLRFSFFDDPPDR
jgi:hypothetical protein